MLINVILCLLNPIANDSTLCHSEKIAYLVELVVQIPENWYTPGQLKSATR